MSDKRIIRDCNGTKKTLLQGGSPATPDDRCKGKDASKLRFVVE